MGRNKFTFKKGHTVSKKVRDKISQTNKGIEVYYTRHKIFFGQAKEGIDKWKQDRTKIFKDYGWDLLFFNEVEVNEKYILEKLNNRGN